MRHHDHKPKSTSLAVVLAFFFGPFGMFYAGVGWGFLAILLTFVSIFVGCGIVVLYDAAICCDLTHYFINRHLLVIGLVLGYGVIHLISLVFSPVVVHYKRQDQLDELDEMEAKQPRAANRHRPKRRLYSYT